MPSESQTAKRPHILLTNDDGIRADGLAAMAQALRPQADLTIVAPSVENSGMGHAISVYRDLAFEPVHKEGVLWGYGLAGTPADCVKVAIQLLSRDRPFDLVVSGINRGQNAGINVLYSGTVAAAREAAILGVPSIAVSAFYHEEPAIRYDTAARVGAEVAARVLANGLPRGVMLNVNVPPLPYETLAGWAVTRMGDSSYLDYFLHQPAHEESPAIYRNIGKGWFPSSEKADDLDDHALMEDKVAVTPLHFDLTAYDFLTELHGWFEAPDKTT